MGVVVAHNMGRTVSEGKARVAAIPVAVIPVAARRGYLSRRTIDAIVRGEFFLE